MSESTSENTGSSMDISTTTSDVKPLVGRIMNSRTRLEWALIVVGVVLSILLIVFVAGYGHCMGMYKDLKEEYAEKGDCHRGDG